MDAVLNNFTTAAPKSEVTLCGEVRQRAAKRFFIEDADAGFSQYALAGDAIAERWTSRIIRGIEAVACLEYGVGAEDVIPAAAVVLHVVFVGGYIQRRSGGHNLGNTLAEHAAPNRILRTDGMVDASDKH